MAKVLLLEEDPTYAQELLRGLTAAGCAVTLARDGDSGLSRATSEPFDVLVVSAELPGINGFRLCAKLKKHPGWITPVVLMGSHRTVGFDEHRKLPSRAQAYLRKPVVLGELVALLEQVRHAPARPTKAPPRLPPKTLRPAAALKSALDSAHEQGAVVTELRKQLAAHEQTITRLGRELENARARSIPPAPDGQSAHEQLGLRQLLNKKERELAEAQAAHGAAKHETMNVERARAALEAKVQELEGERRERDARVQKAEKLAQAARADKDQANKRAEDFGRATERHKADYERAEAQLAAVRADLERTRAELERERERADGLAKTHAEGRAASERARADAEKATGAELDRLRARCEELRAAVEDAEGRLVAARRDAEVTLEEERAARIAEVAELIAKLKDVVSADDDAFKKRMDDEGRRGRELDEVRAEANATKERHARELRGLRGRIEELEAALEAQRDRASEDLTRAEERYVRHMSASLEEQRAKVAGLHAEHERMLAAHARARSDAETELTNVRARAKADAEQARHANEVAIVEAVTRATAAAEAKLRDEKAEEVESLSARLWAEAEEASTKKTSALEARVADAQAHVIARVSKLEAQAAELSLALEKSRRTLDAERRQHLEELGSNADELDGLEAELAKRTLRVSDLEAELAHSRQTHTHEAAAARAALEQLQRDHTLIDQAKTLLAEIVSRDEDDD